MVFNQSGGCFWLRTPGWVTEAKAALVGLRQQLTTTQKQTKAALVEAANCAAKLPPKDLLQSIEDSIFNYYPKLCIVMKYKAGGD